MDLEGTKHEKAVLVVISFIIGFTCGLIAFGINTKYQPVAYIDMAPSNDTVPTSAPELNLDGYVPPAGNPPADEPSEVDMSSSNAAVSYEEGKLYAQVGEERYVLSLRSDVMEVENVEGFATQGLHESLPSYSASPSGKYVYFCEQQTSDPTCTNFVFDTSANVIHFVSVGGEKLVTAIDDAANAVCSGDMLAIAAFASISESEPWKMTESGN